MTAQYKFHKISLCDFSILVYTKTVNSVEGALWMASQTIHLLTTREIASRFASVKSEEFLICGVYYLAILGGGRKSLRWCGFGLFLVRFCGNFYFNSRYCGLKTLSGLRLLQPFGRGFRWKKSVCGDDTRWNGRHPTSNGSTLAKSPPLKRAGLLLSEIFKFPPIVP